ncbi:hypothetical protein HZH66_005729 [Vespula vulgaris]|uniref:Uncharacterized protein n=1 Tax=Vespula vulgaris TaxID=7454 RepID=A0A834N8B4_VESVU|nr:hypothetical protein HZH66_005729 [Vespula vulgaris]
MACRILTGVASTFESISYDPISRFDRNNETSASTMKQSNERILREYYWCIIPGVSMDGSSEAQALISHPQFFLQKKEENGQEYEMAMSDINGFKENEGIFLPFAKPPVKISKSIS